MIWSCQLLDMHAISVTQEDLVMPARSMSEHTKLHKVIEGVQTTYA